ncbi:hypothetical protein [Bacillus sp. E214]|uniref:hypothetical protein n=1 Tax=Bacillus sp. E214 TaxID=2587156 RepID=UPI001651F956|nr:hypothetical protein [Bacillus sp. E214]
MTSYDENISLVGGFFDLNGSTNPTNRMISTGKFLGIGIVFNNVKNLIINNTKKIGASTKYCYLLANIIGGKFENINTVNNSDGLHFQSQCKNIQINNITGLTHDNMIAFTTGDYRTYVISEDEDFENINISNVYSDPAQSAKDLIRFIGAGKNCTGKHKNVKITNVKGITGTNPLIVFMYADQAVSNPYLTKTILENVEVSNIQKLDGSGGRLLYILSNFKNFKVSNLTYEVIFTEQTIRIGGDIDQCIIENVSIFTFNANIKKTKGMVLKTVKVRLPYDAALAGIGAVFFFKPVQR